MVATMAPAVLDLSRLTPWRALKVRRVALGLSSLSAVRLVDPEGTHHFSDADLSRAEAGSTAPKHVKLRSELDRAYAALEASS